MGREAARDNAAEPSHVHYLLQRIAEEAQRALDLDDPLEQARVIATLIQPYSGWALREAVLDCRDNGSQWSKIAPDVTLTQAVLARQVRGAGPVVTIAPTYSDSIDRPGTQTPMRLAAASLVQRTTDLAAAKPEAPTVQHLYITVMALAQALASAQSQPLSKTVAEVLRVADEMNRTPHGLTQPERPVWAAIDELRTAHERSSGAVRMAADPSIRTAKER